MAKRKRVGSLGVLAMKSVMRHMDVSDFAGIERMYYKEKYKAYATFELESRKYIQQFFRAHGYAEFADNIETIRCLHLGSATEGEIQLIMIRPIQRADVPSPHLVTVPYNNDEWSFCVDYDYSVESGGSAEDLVYKCFNSGTYFQLGLYFMFKTEKDSHGPEDYEYGIYG